MRHHNIIMTIIIMCMGAGPRLPCPLPESPTKPRLFSQHHNNHHLLFLPTPSFNVFRFPFTSSYLRTCRIAVMFSTL